MANRSKQTDDGKSPKREVKQDQMGQHPDREKGSRHSRTRDFGGDKPNETERQQDKGYGQQPFDEQQLEPQEDSGSGSFSEGGARGNAGGH